MTKKERLSLLPNGFYLIPENAIPVLKKTCLTGFTGLLCEDYKYSFRVLSILRRKKRWRLFILPQYLANLPKPINNVNVTEKAIFCHRFVFVPTTLRTVGVKTFEGRFSTFLLLIVNVPLSRHLFSY